MQEIFSYALVPVGETTSEALVAIEPVVAGEPKKCRGWVSHLDTGHKCEASYFVRALEVACDWHYKISKQTFTVRRTPCCTGVQIIAEDPYDSMRLDLHNNDCVIVL